MTFLLLVLLCNSVALHFELGDWSPIVFSTDFTIGEVPFYQVLHQAAPSKNHRPQNSEGK